MENESESLSPIEVDVPFNDPLLRKCYDRSFREMVDCPGEQRQIRALIATYEVMRMFEGGRSARVHEIIALMLAPELRPALRKWFRAEARSSDLDLVELRKHLVELTGENPTASAPIANSGDSNTKRAS